MVIAKDLERESCQFMKQEKRSSKSQEASNLQSGMDSDPIVIHSCFEDTSHPQKLSEFSLGDRVYEPTPEEDHDTEPLSLID